MTRRYAPVRRGELRQPDCTAHLRASIEQAGGKYDPETGKYATVKYFGCETRERAKEISDGLYRAARRAKCSVHTEIAAEDDGTWSVTFTAVNKDHARAYVVRTYGKDPEQWPYSPFGRRNGEAP